jgi:hypothetical protein
MTKYILISIVSGILFGIMDGVINANPIAVKMHEIYKPIAKTTVNVKAGILIDLFYGFTLAALFLLLYRSLPGEVGIVKGLSFALIVWFIRVVMSVVTQWMMYEVPINALVYALLTGLFEMIILGTLYGLTLRPWK